MAQMVVWSRGRVWSREEYGAERVCGADGSVEQMVVWNRW